MSKPKFLLTNDLVKVEPEPESVTKLGQDVKSASPKEQDKKEQLSLKISKDIKKKFQLWCVQNGKSMTESLEKAILNFLEKPF